MQLAPRDESPPLLEASKLGRFYFLSNSTLRTESGENRILLPNFPPFSWNEVDQTGLAFVNLWAIWEDSKMQSFRTRIERKKQRGIGKNWEITLWGKDEEQTRTEQKPRDWGTKPRAQMQESSCQHRQRGKKPSKASIKCRAFGEAKTGSSLTNQTRSSAQPDRSMPESS